MASVSSEDIGAITVEDLNRIMFVDPSSRYEIGWNAALSKLKREYFPMPRETLLELHIRLRPQVLARLEYFAGLQVEREL